MSACLDDLPESFHLAHHGDFFSIYVDYDSQYWVVSNNFRSVKLGPYSSFTRTRHIFNDANDFMRCIKQNGVVFYE